MKPQKTAQGEGETMKPRHSTFNVQEKMRPVWEDGDREESCRVCCPRSHKKKVYQEITFASSDQPWQMWPNWLEHHSIDQKVLGLIAGQGDCGLKPQSGHVQESNQLMFLSVKKKKKERESVIHLCQILLKGDYCDLTDHEIWQWTGPWRPWQELSFWLDHGGRRMEGNSRTKCGKLSSCVLKGLQQVWLWRDSVIQERLVSHAGSEWWKQKEVMGNQIWARTLMPRCCPPEKI